MLKKILIALTGLLFVSCSSDDDNGNTNSIVSQVNTNSTAITASMNLEAILSSGAATVKVNDTYFAIGHTQENNNKNPILMRFDNGQLSWARDDYETSGDDGTGTGIVFDAANNRLHVAFTATGTQGNSNEDYRRFTQNGWLPNYGFGGGSRVVILAQINPENGDPINGTYVYSKLSNVDTNSLFATALSYSNNSIILEANSAFSPLKVDQTTFNCQGNSPFNYRVSFNLNLTEALSASAENCE